MIDKLNLYRLAYAFQDEALWRRVPDDAMFAVQHADGSISYCTFDGSEMNIALQVFTVPEELGTFFHLHDLFEKDLNELQEDPYDKGEVPNTPKCLSCFF